ncbi:MAG: ethanolamine permease [Cyclobacteriaceae bacterium]
MASENHLRRVLTPFMIWGIGVGYVISGNYFGWNLGLAEGGSVGLAIATAVVILMYITFTYSYAELACAIPQAGGVFDYTSRALGPNVGFIAGMAQNLEFILAPPAIALGIGSYMHLYLPAIPALYFSVGAYFLFTAVNTLGIKTAALVELMVTLIAVAGLILFAALTIPHASVDSFVRNGLPHGVSGIFAAVPFAIWFFLGIEGVANLAEEAKDPRHTMSRGFLATLFTLIAVCFLTFFGSVGQAGWEAVVYGTDGTTSDAPLPMAIQLIPDSSARNVQILIALGLFGLVASFNGLMLAAGRSLYEFGRVTRIIRWMGTLSERHKTPRNALLLNLVIGLIALFSGKTSEVITLSVCGALVVYISSMISLIVLRRTEPNLDRPFRVPLYPVFPLAALVIAIGCLVALVVFNFMLCAVFAGIVVLAFGIFKVRSSSLTP